MGAEQFRPKFEDDRSAHKFRFIDVLAAKSDLPAQREGRASTIPRFRSSFLIFFNESNESTLREISRTDSTPYADCVTVNPLPAGHHRPVRCAKQVAIAFVCTRDDKF